MFIADQPINTYKRDLLGRYSFAKALAKAILSYKQNDSISLGLFGEWGSGKTSIINMTLEELNSISSQNKPLIIKFNPWNFSDQNQLIYQFFNELSLVLSRDDSAEKHEKIGRAIQKYSRFFEPFSYVPSLSFIGEAAKALKEVGEAAQKAGEEEAKGLISVKDELSSLLDEINTKVIIVIDDIDRLNDTEIRQIFQLVKSLADFPNTIYLLSFDKDIVIQALKKVQEGSGYEYLEKVVQVPFEIPQISKIEVESFLLKKLSELVQDIPEERWDQTYWGNIYHSGLKHLFNNIRDVNRYLNTLGFGFNLVKDEVNPIDFIAITAIQVFIPNLYKDIKGNKDLFAGIHNSYRESGEARKNELSRINSILSKTDVLAQDVLKDFLQRLFPRIENVGYSQSFLESLRKKGRICSPDIFDIYFQLAIPKDEISLKEIERIIATGNNAESFSNELIRLSKENKIIRFLERMEDYTRDDIPEENIIPIINTLMDIGDMFPEGNRDFLTIDTSMRILRLFYQLSHRFKDHEKRFKIFKDAIENSKNSLYTIVNEIEAQCQQHGRYGFNEEPEPPENTTVTSEQLDELVKLATIKIEQWAKSGKLARHHHLLSILFMWRRWNDPDHVNNYVQKLIKNDNGLIEFITHFLSDIKSRRMSDYEGNVSWRIDLENIKIFVNLDNIDGRLRAIHLSPQYNDLEDRQKLAIKTFIDTRDGKIKSRF